MITSQRAPGRASLGRGRSAIQFYSLFTATLLAVVSSTTARADTGSSLSDAEAIAVVAEHNRIRSEAGVIVAIAWDNGLAGYAQEWANELARTEELRHRAYRADYPVGENIAMSWGGRAFSGTDAVRMWEEEESLYHGEAIDGTNYLIFGHYTQIIWDRTDWVGCGRAVSGSGKVYVVCNYYRAGNVIGERPITIFTDGGGGVSAPPMTVVNQSGETLRYRFYVAADGPLPAHWTETFTLSAGESASHNLTVGSTLHAVEAFGSPATESVAVQPNRTHFALPNGAASLRPGGVVESSYWISWYVE